MLYPVFKSSQSSLIDVTVSMAPITTEYDGSPFFAVATATPSTPGKLSYTYYTDSSCTVPTNIANTTNGASTGGVPSDAGTYYVKASVTASGNYKAASTGCIKHTITKKPLTVTWGSKTSFVYNGSEQGPSASVSTGVSGETIILSTTKAITVGNYTSTATCASVTGGNANCNNYTLSNNTKAFEITGAQDKTFEATFDAGEGSLVGYLNLSCSTTGSTCTIKNISGRSWAYRNGYSFDGWSPSQTCTSFIGDEVTLSSNVTYYACYTKKANTEQPTERTFVATLNPDGGVLNPDFPFLSCTVKDNETSCVVKDVPVTASKEGYTFNGWGTGLGCSYGLKENLTLSKELTEFYACYTKNSEQPKENTFVATFDANNGKLNGNLTLSCKATGTNCNVTGLPSATRDGYTFNGWGTTSNCSTGKKSILTLSKNTTYYACYTKNAVETPDDKENVTTNPTTGDIAIAVTWFVGLLAVGYSFYYFKNVKEN